jgi:adenylate cyclase
VVEEVIRDVTATGQFKEVRTRVVTVLFADLVGFTSWSEKMSAEPLTRMLTEFFTLASDEVFAFGGTIDKFIGDAVMAFFGRSTSPTTPAARSTRRCGFARAWPRGTRLARSAGSLHWRCALR